MANLRGKRFYGWVCRGISKSLEIAASVNSKNKPVFGNIVRNSPVLCFLEARRIARSIKINDGLIFDFIGHGDEFDMILGIKVDSPPSKIPNSIEGFYKICTELSIEIPFERNSETMTLVTQSGKKMPKILNINV